MGKARIITARLKFSPRKAGGDMSESQLADWLANTLNFSEGIDVETVADRGDMVSYMLKALKLAAERLEISNCEGEEDAHLATIRAAIAAAKGGAA